MNCYEPGRIWLDTNGSPINAHGGGVIHHEGVYYWYGEHKLPGKSEEEKADGGIHCYSSRDLMNWDDCGVVMSVDYQDDSSDIAYGVVLERPKVVYNEANRQFIAYFKLYEKEHAYRIGYLGVATADSPTGPFTYRHRTLAAASDEGSGDFYMHVDGNRRLHHLGVRKPDKAFCITRMSDDYLHATDQAMPVAGISPHTEAPAGFERDGVFYLLGSGSSSWAPNAARLFRADSPEDSFFKMRNPCSGMNPSNGLGPEKTFGAQSSCVIDVQGIDNAYIAMFDVWNPEKPIEGLYVWLPIVFENDSPVIRWQDRWDLSFFEPVVCS